LVKSSTNGAYVIEPREFFRLRSMTEYSYPHALLCCVSNCSLFEICPDTHKSLKFMDDIKSDWKKNAVFIHHARIVVDMIDCIVCYLGPDLDALAEDMAELGHRHLSYGVKPNQIPAMGEAIIYAFGEFLGDNFTSADQNDWRIVFKFLSEKMIQGMAGN